MKNSAALWLCIGCLVTGLTGCANDLQKGICGVGESGSVCDGSRLVICASGMEVSSHECLKGCANNMCIGETQVDVTCPTPGELKCENSAILQCSNGFWNKTADCPNGCDGVLPQCKAAAQTCTNPANHCSADNTKVVKCDNGQETEVSKCECGCDPAVNACKQCPQCDYQGTKCDPAGTGSVLKCENGTSMFVKACTNGCNEAGTECAEVQETCTDTTEHCNADNTKVVKCQDGSEVEVSDCSCGCDPKANTCKLCQVCDYEGTKCDPTGTGTVFKCENSTESTVKSCTNGCNETGTDCAEVQGTCTDTTNHCNSDNTKVVKCENGNEVKVSDCSCGCDPAVNTCKLCDACEYKGNKCDPTGTGTVLKCENGTETVVSTCQCGCDKDACKECPKCDYKNTKCDSTFSSVLECKDGEEKVVKTCTNEEICNNGKCTGIEAPEVCDKKGLKCLGRTVINCSAANGEFDIIEDCIGTCTNGACDDVACPEKPQPACFDTKTILECDNGTHKMKKTSCGEGESCVSGECFKSEQQSSCSFETQCSADGSAIKSCKQGKVTYENCPVKKYCDASSGTPKCISAMISEDLGLCDEEHFVNACDGEKTAYICDGGSLKVANCNKNQTCISGICRTTTNKKIGDTCTYGSFDDTCIDNTPVTCDSKSKHIVIIENEKNCTEDSAVCGSVESGGVRLFSCYEPCEEKGAILARCILSGDKSYQTKLECVDLGNGKLGLDHINANYDPCDKECKEGKCVDYTEEIEDVGKECDADKFKAYCKDDSRGVTCEENDEEKTVVTVELCDADELCAAYKKYEGSEDAFDTAGCLKQCKAGDPDKYECAGSGFFASTQFTCKKIADSHVYVPVNITLCSQCGDDGKCK